MTDVGLTNSGALVGQVVDSLGKPVANTPVAIGAQGKVPTEATTNAQGYFTVNKLPAGVYVAATAGSAQMVRVWAARTAPPAASKGLLLVESQDVARANLGHGGNKAGGKGKGAGGFVRDHWVKLAIGAGIAGGIIALVDDDDAS